MKKTKLLLPIVMLLSIASCSPRGASSSIYSSSQNSGNNSSVNAFTGPQLNNPQKPFNYDSDKTKAPNAAYISSLNELSKDIFKKLYDGNNQVYSTLSIADCFSMLLDGCRGNSKLQLEALLHYDEETFNHLTEIKNTLLRNAIEDRKNNTVLDVAQSFWVDESMKEGLNPEYIDTLTKYYYAEAFSGDLKSDEMHELLANYINKKTHDFLNVKKDDFATYGGVLWLLNTIYLKTPWAQGFPKESNFQDNFNNLDNTKKQVTFMRNVQKATSKSTDNYSIVSLSLNHDMNFNILLPKEGTNYSEVLTNAEALDDLHNFASSFATPFKFDIEITLPQFKNQISIDLKEFLPKLGVTDIFSPNAANLSAIFGEGSDTANGGFYVSKSKHEAGIEVKNEGLEAAAYTIIVVEKASSEKPKEKIVIDHPFAYTITNSDGIPLFTGVVTNL